MLKKPTIRRFLGDRVLPVSFSLSLEQKFLIAALIGTLTACGVGQPQSNLGTDPNTLGSLVETAEAATPTETTQTTTPPDSKVTLAVEIATPDSTYQLDALRTGKRLYVDREYYYTDVPPAYDGLCYIRPANDDKWSSGMEFLALNANKPVSVYVGVLNTTAPSWLESWTKTDEQLPVQLKYPNNVSLYKKDFPAGTISLGGNEMGGNMYMVLIEDPEASDGDTDIVTGCGAADPDKLTLAWDAGIASVSGYRIYYGPTPDTATQLASDLSVDAGLVDSRVPEVSYSAKYDLGLAPGDHVCLRVKAYNDAGPSDFSEPVCTDI